MARLTQHLWTLVPPAALGLLACAAIAAACGFDGVGAAGGPPGASGGNAESGTNADGAASSDAAQLDAADFPLPGDSAQPCSADLTTDALNCGRCAHSCLGAACVAGACEPATLATRGSPHDIVVDATDVYWTDKGGAVIAPSAARCPKAGGAVIRVATGTVGSNDLESLVVAAGRVFVTDIPTNYVYGCALPGPDCGGPLILTENGPLGIAYNGTNLFWVNGNSGNIRRSGVTLTAPTTIVQNRTAPKRIAATATTVAWTEGGGIGVADVGGNNETNASSATPPRDVAIDASFVYFATATEVRRVTHASAGDTLLATGADLQHLVVDASGIYFTDRGNGGRVLRCPLAGCVAPQLPDVLAAAQASVFGVAVDATHVYWTNETADNGTIRRVAK